MLRFPGKSKTAALLLLLAAGWVTAAQTAATVLPPTSQDLELLRRSTALDPYPESDEAKRNPESLGFFFPRALYPKLLGNPIMGYLYDEGYSCPVQKTVRIAKFRYPKKLAAHAPAFRQCAQLAFQKAGLPLGENGDIELGIAILGVVSVKTEKSLPGLCVEFYLRNRVTGKALFARRSFGSQESLIKAMMQAAVYMTVRAGQ